MMTTGSNDVGERISVRPATLFDETFPITHIINEYLTQTLLYEVFW